MKKREKNKKSKRPLKRRREPTEGFLPSVNLKAEESFRKSQENFPGLLEKIDIGYFELDLRGNLNYFNDVLCRKMGYSREELLGMNYQVYSRPQDFDFLKSLYREIYGTGKPKTTINIVVIKKDGSKMIVEQSISLKRDPSGQAVGFQVVALEITERISVEEALRQSEEKYRMIAENVYDMIWAMNLDMVCTYVSPSVFRITGFAPQEFQRKSVNEMTTPASYKIIADLLSEELAREKSGNVDRDRSRTIEFEMITKSGGTVWVEATATFSRDDKGQATGILGVTRDISERRESEEERARLEEQLRQAQKMESVGRLAGGVAHDFNNMLSVILGYAELIKLNLPAGDQLLLDVEEIEKAATRSRDVTRQLLAFSRKQIIAPMTVDLNSLITGIQKTLARLIGEDINLQFLSHDDLCNIKFDPAQMQQILINLSINARDAMPNGGNLIIETRKKYLDEAYCKMHMEFSPGHYVLLTVSDDGSGMSKEILQHLFEPFFTTKETGRGTGLGLATVYGIIKQNDGFINVYSEPGKGSSFHIYVPRSAEEGEALDEDGEESVLSGSGTILLVEDDEMVRKMTAGMLEAIGYTVLSTGDPAEAQALCENEDIQIDLLMTDVVMPGMSGKELRNRIKAKRPEIKVLFMSGYTSDVIVHRGVLEEGVQFVQKPFSMRDLARNVRNAINQHPH